MFRSRTLARRCLRLLGRTGRDRRAATAVEYGMIAALIVIAMIASFKNVASTTVSLWSNTQTKIGNATGY